MTYPDRKERVRYVMREPKTICINTAIYCGTAIIIAITVRLIIFIMKL